MTSKSNPSRSFTGPRTLLLLALLLCAAISRAQTNDVTLRVHLSPAHEATGQSGGNSANVVVWLTPLDSVPPSAPPARPRSFTLVQKDKQFSPHLLVVPVGSRVSFPNQDPFFHNVFSLFNGKRFDLGLYEAHTDRAVQFDREGVSYIFCNIHPRMAAVIVTLSTPYFAISNPEGAVRISGVPPGTYRLGVWAENVPAEELSVIQPTVLIDATHHQLPDLHLHTSGDLAGHHSNKFGESYPPDAKDPY